MKRVSNFSSEASHQRKALTAAMTSVLASAEGAFPENVIMMSPVMAMDVINAIGNIVGKNDDRESLGQLYEFTRAAFPDREELVIAMDRVGIFFEMRLKHLERRGRHWSRYAHTKTSVKAMNRMTSRSGPAGMQLLTVLVSYEWARFSRTTP